MQPHLDVLLLEDERKDAARIERALSDGGLDVSIRRVDTQAAFTAELERALPDVILCDFNLPDINGLSALKLAGEHSAAVPVIIVTGALLDEVAVTLLREGAADYVLKDRLSRLPSAVRRAIDAVRAETTRREAEEKYRLVFAEARDGIVLIDGDTGLIVDCNVEFERQCGRTLQQLQQMAIWQLRPPARVEAARRKFEEVRDRGVAADDRLEFLKPDGTEVPVEFRARQVVLLGRPHVLSISRDISGRLETDRRLLDQLDELRRFQRVAVDRELRMEELEAEIQRLRAEPVES
jgi:PAS domain S-box-containing protein